MNSKQLLELSEKMSKVEIDLNGCGTVAYKACASGFESYWKCVKPISGHAKVTAKETHDAAVEARLYAHSLLTACDNMDRLVDEALALPPSVHDTPERLAWYVAGVEDEGAIPMLWDTKIAAEAYARECFPDEDPDKRYGRIYYRLINKGA